MTTHDEVIEQAQYSRHVAGEAADMLLRFATNKTHRQLGITRAQVEEMSQHARHVGGEAANTLDALAEEFLINAPPPPPPPPDPTNESLIIRPDVIFAAKSYVHTKLATDAEIDPNSAALVADFDRQVHSGYGAPDRPHVDLNTSGFTPVLYIVGPDQPTVAVGWLWGPDPANTLPQQWAAVPMPDGFNAAAGTDMEALIYQPSTDTIWEFWVMAKTGNQVVNSAGATVDEWGAYWGGKMENVSANPGVWLRDPNTQYPYGTTASSLPFLFGMMTVAEMRQDPPKIEHALGIALMDIAPWDQFSLPALRSDGNGNSPIMMGTCFRFPADLDLATFGLSPVGYAVARAIQDYGMYVWDTSGVVGFRGENPTGQYPEGDPWWKDGGILGCAAIPDNDQWVYACWGPAHFSPIPWHLLQTLKLHQG